jgi:ATP-dependent DNA ligase
LLEARLQQSVDQVEKANGAGSQEAGQPSKSQVCRSAVLCGNRSNASNVLAPWRAPSNKPQLRPVFASILASLNMMLPAFQPIAVSRRPHPFDDSQWLFELKYDGFRALAYLDNGRCRLVSRNGHPFASFADLASSIATLADATTAVFDGEIVCVDPTGRPRFNDLLFRRRDPVFFASTCFT